MSAQAANEIVAGAIALYFLGGVGLAFAIDASEMDKDVPYGELPSVASLETIRAWVFLFVVLFGSAYVIRAMCLAHLKTIRVYRRARRIRKMRGGPSRYEALTLMGRR